MKEEESQKVVCKEGNVDCGRTHKDHVCNKYLLQFCDKEAKHCATTSVGMPPNENNRSVSLEPCRDSDYTSVQTGTLLWVP